jgi:hypothetical protein
VTDVTVRLKDKADCPCGCGLYGTVRSSGCVKGCTCRRCKGRNSKRNGQRQQARAFTALGRPTSQLHPGHEESITGALRLEVKATKAEASVVLTAFDRMRAQSEAARPIGDNRPFVGVAMDPAGRNRGVVLIELDDLAEAVAALVEALGMLP